MRHNRSVPRSTVIPVLDYPDVGAAIDWLVAAFGFELRMRIGDHRAQMHVGDGNMVIRELHPGSVRGNDHSVLVRVDDVDAHHARAAAHGAEILLAPQDHPFGERQYSVRDLGGHAWSFSQTIADLAPEEWGGQSGRID